ncbi:hypothetical protein SRABI106_02414 [Rahnella aquatilis]|nr:hypothetical protein SRABI106_02414 [Rahnella aquatilis]
MEQDNPTSNVTRIRDTLPAPRLCAPRVPSRKTSLKLPWVIFHAGNALVTTAVMMTSTNALRIMTLSSDKCHQNGILFGTNVGSNVLVISSPQAASRTAMMPEKAQINKLSHIICMTRRPEGEPRATRIAISFERSVVLASNKLPTLQHASTSTKATAKSMTMKIGMVSSPMKFSWNVSTCADSPLLLSGYSEASDCIT